jgi:hypothetical protein
VGALINSLPKKLDKENQAQSNKGNRENCVVNDRLACSQSTWDTFGDIRGEQCHQWGVFCHVIVLIMAKAIRNGDGGNV